MNICKEMVQSRRQTGQGRERLERGLRDEGGSGPRSFVKLVESRSRRIPSCAWSTAGDLALGGRQVREGGDKAIRTAGCLLEATIAQ